MSVIGTGTAAAVAQTALQAQQVARKRDREKTESADDARRLREMFEAHLRALEEGDEAEGPAQLNIDGELPEHQGPPQQIDAVHRRSQEEHPAQDHDDTADAQSEATSSADPPLYRHLDVQA